MANKVTLASLAAKLAISTGLGHKECEDFLTALFDLVAEALARGESVKIRDFGTFKTLRVESRRSVNVTNGENFEIPSHSKVVFIPSKEYASKVNEAFEMFDTVELNGDDDFEGMEMAYEIDELMHEEEEPGIIPEVPRPGETYDIPHREDRSQEEDGDTDSDIDISENKNSEDTDIPKESLLNRQPIEGILETGSLEEKEDDESTAEAYLYEIEEEDKATKEKLRSHSYQSHGQMEYRERRSESRFGKGFLYGVLSAMIVCVCIFVIGYYFGWYNEFRVIDAKERNVATVDNPVYINGEDESDDDGVTEEEDGYETDEIEENQPVYDTVTTTRYLTTISRDHYGNYNLWPYIYIENEAILGHPDRIRPGTQIVVPPLEKYGVDPTNRADIEEAKRKGKEIYDKFR